MRTTSVTRPATNRRHSRPWAWASSTESEQATGASGTPRTLPGGDRYEDWPVVPVYTGPTRSPLHPGIEAFTRTDWSALGGVTSRAA